MQTTVKAYAKINWALDITGRLENGYHEMDMLMQNVDLADDISLSEARFHSLTINERPAGNMEKNLVYRAVKAFCEYTQEKRKVKVNLIKRIPVRAGLGGGSADCAATLIALNDLWKKRLPIETLMKIGLTLGADVPYCLAGGFCRVRGIGEKVEPLSGAPKKYIAITVKGDGLSTQAIFTDFDKMNDGALQVDIGALAGFISEGDYQRARETGKNALERAATRTIPEIKDTIDEFLRAGAVYARMSGSGSAVYGVFDTKEQAAAAAQEIPGAFVTETLTMPSRLEKA